MKIALPKSHTSAPRPCTSVRIARGAGFILMASIGLLLFEPSQASAGGPVLATAQYYLQISGPGNPEIDYQGQAAGVSKAVSLDGGDGIIGSASVNTVGFVLLQAGGNGGGATVFGGGSGDSYLTYQFEVTGTGSGLIPVDVKAALNSYAVDPNYVYNNYGASSITHLNINQKFTDWAWGTQACFGCSGFTSALNVNSVVYVQPNTPVSVSEYAFAGGTGGGIATASADPFFQIDPGFQNSNPGYQLFVSNGVGNAVSAAPEPATWALMLLGFGGVGVAMRRSRRTVFHAIAPA